MKRIICFLTISLLFLTVCATTQIVYSPDGKWYVVRLRYKVITPTENTPYLVFDMADGTVGGHTGCNMLFGNFNVNKFKKGVVKFSSLNTTCMGCPDNPYERDFLNALGQAKRVEINAKEMKLKDVTGQVIMVLKKAPPKKNDESCNK